MSTSNDYSTTITPRDTIISPHYAEFSITQENNNDNNSNHVNFTDSFSEMNNKHTIKSIMISETFGMATFIFLSLSNISIYGIYPEAQLNWTGVALSWGLNLLAGIHIAKNGSNAYLNPCVAFADAIFNRSITIIELVYYTIAEILGAFIGAALNYLIHYSAVDDIYDNSLNGENKICTLYTTYKNDNTTFVSAFFNEMIGTFLLTLGIFYIVNNSTKACMNPVCISAVLSTLVLSIGFQTAFSFNFARDFGPRLFVTILNKECFALRDYYFLIPLTADYTGAILAGILYKYV